MLPTQIAERLIFPLINRDRRRQPGVTFRGVFLQRPDTTTIGVSGAHSQACPRVWRPARGDTTAGVAMRRASASAIRRVTVRQVLAVPGRPRRVASRIRRSEQPRPPASHDHWHVTHPQHSENCTSATISERFSERLESVC